MDRVKDRTTEYARKVLAGRIITGKLVRNACERHMEMLKKSKTKAFPFYFDVEAAERIMDFFGFLCHSKGEWAGKPVVLELWQCFIVGSIFGWKHKKTDLRMYRTAYVQVAKKNGKSTMLAGLGVYLTMADGEQGAEVYSAATKRDQARIIFDEAKRMVNASSSIKKYLEVLQRNINMPRTNSKFEPLSSDVNSLDGLNIHGGLIDELHAHKTREIYDIIANGTAARQQPLIFGITTAGFDNHGIAYELYEYGCNILNGHTEDNMFFCYIAQIDHEDDWRDESCWIKANPNLGVSVKLEDLRMKAERAKQIPAAQNNFLCKHLNMWVNQEIRWMDMERWKACHIDANDDIKIEDLKGKSCYVGIDLSSTTDMTSVNFEFPFEDGRYAVISHSFIPENRVLEKEKKDGVSYRTWIKKGYITETPGDVVDYSFIESYIMQMSDDYDIREICYDPWNATQLAQNLTNEGFTTVEIRQGYRTLSEPTKDIMSLVLQKKLLHFNNPVLAWAMNNAIVTMDPAENIKLDKSKAQYRIDPAVALVISHVRAMVSESAVDISEYATEEFLNKIWS